MENENTKITIKPNGQIAIQGPADIVDIEGNVIKHGPRFTLCGCSKSSNKPFCDGSHNA
jgi:CDGSH-type Zn-finger protein